jgi:polar amino acid transport system substrate-binding protein
MDMRGFLKTMIAAAIGAALTAGPALADPVAEIKKKGVLVVGVKTDYPPWGTRDAAGNIVGMEADMAADVARRLGVKLELVSVVSSNRMQFLQQGKIDLMIATMSDTAERRKVVGIVDPVYYASGVAILANKRAAIKNAGDLKGKPVCALQGAFYNNDLQAKYTGRDLVAFRGVPEAEQALLDGRCVGFVYDDVVLVWKKAQETKWGDFEVVQLNEWQPVPWGLAVRIEDLNGSWGKFMSDTVADWLKSGALLDLEKKWVGGNTAWLTDATAKAKK